MHILGRHCFWTFRAEFQRMWWMTEYSPQYSAQNHANLEQKPLNSQIQCCRPKFWKMTVKHFWKRQKFLIWRKKVRAEFYNVWGHSFNFFGNIFTLVTRPLQARSRSKDLWPRVKCYNLLLPHDGTLTLKFLKINNQIRSELQTIKSVRLQKVFQFIGGKYSNVRFV